jgi:hypothetical protein
MSAFRCRTGPRDQIERAAVSVSNDIAGGLERGWADSLQNSETKGQRHLTDKARRAAREREAFLEHLRQIRERQTPEYSLSEKGDG